MLKTLRLDVRDNPLYVLMEAQCHRAMNALNHLRKMEENSRLEMDLLQEEMVETVEITVLAMAATEEMEVTEVVVVVMEETELSTYLRCLADNIR
jgi:hypothetical protein